MTDRRRLGWMLGAGGVLGVLSLLLLDLNRLLALIPPEKNPQGFTVGPLLRGLSLLQPTLLLTVAVIVGLQLADRVGLGAPFLAALAQGKRPPSFTRHAVHGVAGGMLGGAFIVLAMRLFFPHFPETAAGRISEFQATVPIATRLLYGGITEEVLLRWGLMTFLVWAAWRVFQRNATRPPASAYMIAIAVTAVLFGVGHLPIAFAVVPDPNAALIAFVVIANAAFGIMVGYLYWKRSLECAIVAHLTTHLTLLAASRAELYF
jgi:hypothetical protein